MATKNKLVSRAQSLLAFRKKTAGASTTVPAANVAGAATITATSGAGITTGMSLQYGDGEDIERVEVQSVATNVITLVKPLARDHAAGHVLKEQIGYNLGDVKGTISSSQAVESEDVTSALRRLVFQKRQGFATFGIDVTVHGFTPENAAIALGIPLARVLGNGASIATPKVLATDFNDLDTESDVCIVATIVLQDGSVKTYEFWGVYSDYTAFAVQLAIGQGADGAVPMKFQVFGMGVEQDGAPTYVADTSIKAGKGKVFGELTGVGLYVAHATPAATTVATAAAADAGTLVLASGTNYAANDWIVVGVDDTLEVHWVDSVATNTLTLRTKLLRAQAVGVTVSRLAQLPFAAIGKEGAKLAVGGSTTPIQNGLRRLPIGAQPGFVDVSLTLSLLEMSLANRAYALGIAQSEIANSRLIMTEKIGRSTVVAAYVTGLLKDGTVNILNFWAPVQDLASVATQFGDANGSSIPWVGKPTSGIQLIQYAV